MATADAVIIKKEQVGEKEMADAVNIKEEQGEMEEFVVTSSTADTVNIKEKQGGEEELVAISGTPDAVNREEHGGEEELVVILDAGAQYGKIIDRRVRELGIKTDILPLGVSAEELLDKNLKAIIISGSGESVNGTAPLSYDPHLFQLGVPVLGICYGFHLIVKHFGGLVSREDVREDGQFEVTVDSQGIFESLEKEQKVLLTHGDSVKTIPDCLKAIGWSGDLITAISHVTLPIYGVQFHPEVDLTINGLQILKTFLYKISGCSGSFCLESREASCLEYIRQFIGDGHVLSLVSGGVDSTVCTALISKALGSSRVSTIHIDNGFLRKNEVEQVVASLKPLGISAQVIDAILTFRSASTIINYQDQDGRIHAQPTPFLNRVTNAEEKRHIIGDTFAKIASDLLIELDARGKKPIYLAQGTLRPDLIESASLLASSNAHVIKTHHNDTPLVRELRSEGRVIEPLIDFHKDEVRRLGTSLGLPPGIVYRHPFPGPGLAIRVLCQDDPYLRDDFTSTNMLLNTIATYAKNIGKSNGMVETIKKCLSPSDKLFLYNLTCNAVFNITMLPVCSVGVQGDSRTYSHVAVISSESEKSINWNDRMKLAKLIPKISHTINRLVWAFGGVVNGPIIDITPTRLTTGVLSTLREVDHLAHSVLISQGVYQSISQMPVVLIPIHFDRNPQEILTYPSCQRSVVLRPFVSQDFMTGIPALPGHHLPIEVIHKMVENISKVPTISRVLYDLTPKPPGTTEWE